MVARSLVIQRENSYASRPLKISVFFVLKKHIKRTIIVALGSSFARITQDANNHARTHTTINHFTLGNLSVILRLSSSTQGEIPKHPRENHNLAAKNMTSTPGLTPFCGVAHGPK